MDQYEVEITSAGRSGNVIYREQGGSISFWWEFSTNGAYINIPSDENWDKFCENEKAEWAKGRKKEIVGRLADETKKLKAASSEIKIEDEWINFYF